MAVGAPHGQRESRLTHARAEAYESLVKRGGALSIAVAAIAGLLACSSDEDADDRGQATVALSAECALAPWDGDEPDDFTHFVDRDGDGNCEAHAVKVNGAWPNGLYPNCETPNGRQLAHAHWEYTSRQTDAAGETEEKDYFRSSPDAESVMQSLRFALNEPGRFARLLLPNENPDGRYWQVDEWIGPIEGRVGFSWGERFFACDSALRGSGPCATVDGKRAYGGYWSTQAEGLLGADVCGDAYGADADPERSETCGRAFLDCVPTP